MLAKGNGCFWEKVPGLPTGHHPPFAVTFQFSVPEGPNGRFSAGNLTVGISRPGHELPVTNLFPKLPLSWTTPSSAVIGPTGTSLRERKSAL